MEVNKMGVKKTTTTTTSTKTEVETIEPTHSEKVSIGMHKWHYQKKKEECEQLEEENEKLKKENKELQKQLKEAGK